MEAENTQFSECEICAEKFTKLVRKKITCKFCDFACCKNCIQTQITTEFTDPACMNPACRKIFSREYMNEIFSKNFLEKDFRRHREETLFIREQSLFPDAMPHIERDIMAENLEKESEELEESIMELRLTIANLRNEARIRRHQSYQLRERGLVIEGEAEKVRRKFVKKCPNEGCEGFLSTRWKCAICNTNVCPDCHCVKAEETTEDENIHVCNPSDIESAKLISKECKGCPKCGIDIFKIEGCDQMWCTQCFTAFSWNTGQIVSGVVHNPHYFQFMANNGNLQRQPGDFPCGGVPGVHDIITFFTGINLSYSCPVSVLKYRKKMLTISRFLTHCELIEIPNLTLNLTDINLNLRKQFIRKQIDENNFKQQLSRRERENNRKNELRQVFETFTQAGGDILRNLTRSYVQKVTLDDLSACCEEFWKLCEFGNEAFLNISKLYKTKPYRVEWYDQQNLVISRT